MNGASLKKSMMLTILHVKMLNNYLKCVWVKILDCSSDAKGALIKIYTLLSSYKRP